jgi:chaperonin GroEL (HSP60 family)
VREARRSVHSHLREKLSNLQERVAKLAGGVAVIRAGGATEVKVVRTSLQDAASVASLLITTGALVAELPKED